MADYLEDPSQSQFTIFHDIGDQEGVTGWMFTNTFAYVLLMKVNLSDSHRFTEMK